MKHKIFFFLIFLSFATVFSQTKKVKRTKAKIPSREIKQKSDDVLRNLKVNKDTSRDEIFSRSEAPFEKETPKTGFDVFSVKDKKGIKNYTTNEIVLKPEFRDVTKQSENIFQVVSKCCYGIFNTKLNKMVVDTIYSFAIADFFSDKNGILNEKDFVVKIKNWNSNSNSEGLIDSNYKVIFEPEYDLILANKDYVHYGKNRLTGIHFFDTSKKNIPMEYKEIYSGFPEGCFIGKKENSTTLFDSNGIIISDDNKIVAPFINYWEDKRNSLVLIVTNKNKFGFYDNKSKTNQIPIIYDNIIDVFDEKYIVKKDGKFGIITSKNEKVIPFEYDTLRYYKPNKAAILVLASKSKKWGLINLQNKNITKFIYDEIEEINGFYKVKFESKYYVINSGGSKISEIGFDSVGEFFNGKAAVVFSGKLGYLDNNGKLIYSDGFVKKSVGFSSLDEVYKKFVDALKSKDEILLKEFSEKICVDLTTQELFERISYNYRGFPYQTRTRGITIEMIQSKYYEMISKFREMLIRNNEIESLVFDKLEIGRFGYFDLKTQILGTEQHGIIKSNKNTYSYKLGEMMYIDGFWKTFTDPKY